MSQKYISGHHGDIVLGELPGEYTFADFTENYMGYLQTAMDDEKSSKTLGVVLQIVAAVIIFVGLIGLGGPSVIQVGPSGPTLFEMIQILPGPIISVGFFLLTIGGWVAMQGADPVMNEELYLLRAWRIKLSCGHDCEQALLVKLIAPDTFRIAFATESGS